MVTWNAGNLHWTCDEMSHFFRILFSWFVFWWRWCWNFVVKRNILLLSYSVAILFKELWSMAVVINFEKQSGLFSFRLLLFFMLGFRHDLSKVIHSSSSFSNSYCRSILLDFPLLNTGMNAPYLRNMNSGMICLGFLPDFRLNAQISIYKSVRNFQSFFFFFLN